jgi:hypothetical protein
MSDLYAELSYYTLAHGDLVFIHQHVVDAHAAQTADENTKPITLAFALIGLYLYIEKNWTGRDVQQAHMKLAQQRKQWPKFDTPDNRGTFTVADVLAAPPGEERDAAIRAWCAAVWDAYSDTHQAIADLVRVELKI